MLCLTAAKSISIKRLYPIFIILAILGLPVLLSLCISGNKANPYFEATVEDATDVLYATYLGYSEERAKFIHEFKVEKIFKGETEEVIIHVYWPGKATKFMYKKDKKYYLALQRWVYVYDPHDRYQEIYSVRVRPGNEASLTAKIEKILKNAKETYPERGWTIETRPYYGTAYIQSEELADIVRGSDVIFCVKIKEAFTRGIEGTDTCECIVEETLKGSYDYKILTINLLKGTAEAGKEYILLASNQPGGGYILSSRDSLQPPEKREEIERLIGADN